MIIIISGCDRTGKTTLSNNIRSHFSSSIYKHFQVPASAQAAKDEYFSFLDNIDPNQLYILDRFYECEAVYAPIYRNYTLSYQQEIEQLLREKFNVLFVYVQSDLDVIKQRIINCGEDYVHDDDITKVINNYKQFMNTIKLPYIIAHNNIEQDINSNTQLILKYINMIQENKIYGYGNLQADRCIVVNDINNYQFCENDFIDLNIDTDKNLRQYTGLKQFRERNIVVSNGDSRTNEVDSRTDKADYNTDKTNYNNYWFTTYEYANNDLEHLSINDILYKSYGNK